MRKITRIECRSEEIDFGRYDETTEEWTSILDMDDSEMKKWAKELGCKPEFLVSISHLVSDIRESITNDLVSLWKRIDEIEKAMRG